MFHTQGILNLVFDFINDPRIIFGDYLFVVHSEVPIKLFNFRGIVIDLFFDEAVDVFSIDSENEYVFGMRLIVDPHFCEWIKTNQSNHDRKYRVFRAVLLSGGDHMLSDCKLSKLSMHVEQYGYADVLAPAQEAKFGASKGKIKIR